MKKVLFLTMMAITAVLVSCGSGDKKNEGSKGSEANEVTTTDPALNCEGLDLSEYISVESVSKPTLVPDEDWPSYKSQVSITVKLKLIKKLEARRTDKYGTVRVDCIDLCDENETLIEKAEAYDKLESLIGVEPGKIVTINASTKGYDNQKKKKLLSRIKKARVNTFSQNFEFGKDEKISDEEQEESSEETEE